MKTKLHLFYGIVIGILLCSSFGSIKKDKAEFEVERIVTLPDSTFRVDKELKKWKGMGWTIINTMPSTDKNGDTRFYAHIGK